MRLGLLGGTFDPIHLGHLILAEQARDALGLDRTLLMPAARPPHKPVRPITPYPDRYRMLELAVAGSPGLEVSDLERVADRPSYTGETLTRLREELGASAELWLIVGGDSLRDLPSWREPERIFELARLAVLARPGETENPSRPPGAKVDWLGGARIRLSSSEIRQRVSGGRSIRFLVPEPVREYIEREGLYQTVSEGDQEGTV